MSAIMNPDCRAAKHASCTGDGWDEAHDHEAPCPCECHDGPVGGEHFTGCPCGACQQLRPPPPTPVGWWPCCGAIFPTRPHHGEYIGTAPHAAHCKQTVGISIPKEK